jgi:hypothetical protein
MIRRTQRDAKSGGGLLQDEDLPPVPEPEDALGLALDLAPL